MIDLALVLGAYLLGSVSWSVLLVRLLQGRDVRAVGSGNAGASNVMRAAGRGPALAVLSLDLAKGIAPVLLAQSLSLPWVTIGAVGLAAVVGHVFPLWFGFRGGKGVATAAGALMTMSPHATAGAIAIFGVVVAATRLVSLGSISAALALPPLAWAFGALGWTDRPAPVVLLAALAIVAIVVVKHRANLERLRAGTEPRFGEKRV